MTDEGFAFTCGLLFIVVVFFLLSMAFTAKVAYDTGFSDGELAERQLQEVKRDVERNHEMVRRELWK